MRLPSSSHRLVAKPAHAEKATVPETGARARGKARKLAKIRRAARELFIEKGYDHTTTRAIACRAGVALGTLFTYAADKRDLLFLIFNDELEDVAARAFAGVPDNVSFADQLVGIFRAFYIFFTQQPDLARFMLRELTFYIEGPEARRFQEHREKILADLTELVDQAKSEGRIGSDEDSAVAAMVIWAIYASEIRRWLGDEKNAPDLARGLAALRRAFTLLIDGLKPRAE
jgi:AcrR family transcriptional regulator